ncbi:hypothetical protein C8Q72DRAFT_771651 [Fomitopsis betulina]|nr:hypothetical protein C8Q72DRAFT_771651 [Fomitopsis betulina]
MRTQIFFAKAGWRASNHCNALPQRVKHQCPSFKESLAQYIYCLKNAHPLSSAQLPDALANMPFNHLDIFHSFKFAPASLNDDTEETDAVKATPVKGEQPARFDTVVVMQDEDAEATGLQSTSIGHVKVIFKLPTTLHDPCTHELLLAPTNWAASGPLAYVEWYAKLPKNADPIHMMYTVTKPPLRSNGSPPGDIIPISMIRQSCQLCPIFPAHIPTDWTLHNVLDRTHHFLLNNSASKYAYQTLW